MTAELLSNRRRIVAANFKMNGTPEQVAEVASASLKASAGSELELPFFVPAVFLPELRRSNPNISLGAQNCHSKLFGPFTGSLSAPMLYAAGAREILLGHSECRAAGDDNAAVADKIITSAQAGLAVTLCIGENEAQYTAKRTAATVLQQLSECLGTTLPPGLRIAYEPLWAIGTGRTPAIEEITATHQVIAQYIKSNYQVDVPVLYGGSVNAGNAAALAASPAVNGVLVGGACLRIADFIPIIKAFTATTATKDELAQ